MPDQQIYNPADYNLDKPRSTIESSAGHINELFTKEKEILIERKARLENDRDRVQEAVRKVMHVLAVSSLSYHLLQCMEKNNLNGTCVYKNAYKFRVSWYKGFMMFLSWACQSLRDMCYKIGRVQKWSFKNCRCSELMSIDGAPKSETMPRFVACNEGKSWVRSVATRYLSVIDVRLQAKPMAINPSQKRILLAYISLEQWLHLLDHSKGLTSILISWFCPLCKCCFTAANTATSDQQYDHWKSSYCSYTGMFAINFAVLVLLV